MQSGTGGPKCLLKRFRAGEVPRAGCSLIHTFDRMPPQAHTLRRSAEPPLGRVGPVETNNTGTR